MINRTAFVAGIVGGLIGAAIVAGAEPTSRPASRPAIRDRPLTREERAEYEKRLKAAGDTKIAAVAQESRERDDVEGRISKTHTKDARLPGMRKDLERHRLASDAAREWERANAGILRLAVHVEFNQDRTADTAFPLVMRSMNSAKAEKLGGGTPALRQSLQEACSKSFAALIETCGREWVELKDRHITRGLKRVEPGSMLDLAMKDVARPRPKPRQR